MARILGCIRVVLSFVALSFPLVLLSACTSTPPTRVTNSFNPAGYKPPLREIPIRTESAGVRLNEEYCIDSSSGSSATQTSLLTQSLPRLIISVQKLLPIPAISTEPGRSLSCNG